MSYFKFGTFIGGILCAWLYGVPSPQSPIYRAWRWISTLDQEPEQAVLHYFDIRGRAEAIRIAFHDHSFNYTENNFTGVEWGKAGVENNFTTKPNGIKAKMLAEGKLAFGQVPMLEVDGLQIVQSHSILRFVARKEGWYDDYKDKSDQLAFIDMAADGTEDLRKRLMAIKYDENIGDAEKKAKYESWFSAPEEGALWFGHFEALLGKSRTKWVAGTANPTHADYLLFDLIETAEALETASATALFAKFPKLKSWKDSLASRPNIAAYLSSRKEA